MSRNYYSRDRNSYGASKHSEKDNFKEQPGDTSPSSTSESSSVRRRYSGSKDSSTKIRDSSTSDTIGSDWDYLTNSSDEISHEKIKTDDNDVSGKQNYFSSSSKTSHSRADQSPERSKFELYSGGTDNSPADVASVDQNYDANSPPDSKMAASTSEAKYGIGPVYPQTQKDNTSYARVSSQKDLEVNSPQNVIQSTTIYNNPSPSTTIPHNVPQLDTNHYHRSEYTIGHCDPLQQTPTYHKPSQSTTGHQNSTQPTTTYYNPPQSNTVHQNPPQPSTVHHNLPQSNTVHHNPPQLATTFQNTFQSTAGQQVPQQMPTTYNDPPRSTTIQHNPPQPATTFQNTLQSTAGQHIPPQMPTTYHNPPQSTIGLHRSPQIDTACFNQPQSTTVHHNPSKTDATCYNTQQFTTDHHNPPQPGTTYINPQQPTVAHNNPQQSSTSHHNLQQPTTAFYNPQQSPIIQYNATPSTAFPHNQPLSATFKESDHSVENRYLRTTQSPIHVNNNPVDMTDHTRTVIVTTANPIKEPQALTKYFNQFLRGSCTEDVVMDTFAGVVYITFSSQKGAQMVCQVHHDPFGSNILNIRLCQPNELEFFYDRISVHGDILRKPGFNKELFDFVWKRAGVRVKTIIQTDCLDSLLLFLENTQTIMDISRILRAVSLEFEILVAPVKKCFIISVLWDQTLLRDDVIEDYIKWKCHEANVLSKYPCNYGQLFYLRDEPSVSRILSETNHTINGIAIDVRYFHPCLTAETYRTFEISRQTRRLNGQKLKADHSFQQNSNYERDDDSSTQAFNYMYGGNQPPVQQYGQSSRHEQDIIKAGTSSVDDKFSTKWSQPKVSKPSLSDERYHSGNFGNNSNSPTQQTMSKTPRNENLVLDFKQDELILLVRTKLIEEVKKECDDIEIYYDIEQCKVHISGDARSLKLAKLTLEDNVRKKFQTYDLSGLKNEEKEIINMKGFSDKINAEFKKKKIPAHMSCDKGKITLLYNNEVDTAKIEKVIRQFFVSEEYKIDKNKVLFYQSKNWSDYLQKFKSEDTDYEFSVIKLNTKVPSLLVVGTASMQYEMKIMVERFEAENKSKATKITFENDFQEYANKFLAEKLKDIEVAAKNNGVTVRQTDNAFIIEGLEGGLNEGAAELEEIRDSIKTRKQTLDYPGCREFLESPAGEDILRTSGKKYSCLMKLSDQGSADELSDECIEENLTLMEWGIIKNCKVSITKGDPENLKVDCILNFINTSFSNCTTMPKGFVGGQASWNKIAFIVGHSLEVNGERNKCLKIFHYVCTHEEKHLIDALKRGFYKARSMKFKYIGISLDGIQHLERSQGQFCKPLAETLSDQLYNYPNSVNEIYLCGNSDAYLHNVALQLKLKPQQAKHLGKSKGHSGTVEFKVHGKSTLKTQESQAATYRSSSSALAKETRSKIVFKPITVELISGDILAEKADALVTSIQSDLNMKLGLVIRSVLQKGGDEIQDELHTKYPNGIKGGEFAVSGGGKLPFQRIYHATLPQWNATTSGDVIQKLVTDLLNEASKESLTSIAIPALGTGNLSYDSEITSKNILSAIRDFAQGNQQTSLTTVKLVIFTTNIDIMKEYGHAIFKFEKASQSQPKGNPPNKKSNISFGTLDVKLTIGDITAQKTHAIVVSVDGTLDLSKGRVAYSILTKGGQGVQAELKQKYPKGLNFYEFGMTDPGDLSCQVIYFISIPPWNKFEKKKMQKLIVDLLSDIDKKQAATVSLPAFGTGNLGYPADDTQKRTLKAISVFAKSNPQNLRSIEIVVHPTDNIVQQAFQKGLSLPILASPQQTASPQQQASVQQTTPQVVSKETNESPGILAKLLSAFGLGSLANYMGIGGDQKSTDNTCTVGNVTLTVKKGDITEESCDALVAAVYDNMDLETAGAVCLEISKKCALDFKSKCFSKANELQVYGMTSLDVQGGSLKCKEIYFISMNQYCDKWDLAITKVLECADKSGYTTLALPTFGAGLPDSDINNIIKQIKGAITKFGNEQPKKLKDIRLVVYDKDMLKRVNKSSNETSKPNSGTEIGEEDELSENAHIIYYFIDEAKVKGAMEEVMTQCMMTHKENTYKNISIKQFTDANFKSLEKKGIENMVKVTCNKDEGIIHMAGFGDMSKVQNMIHSIEKEMQRELFDNLNTDTPVHWQYEKDGKFVDFNNQLNLQLEADFKGKKTSSVIEMDDETYIVDFENKIITHNDTGSIMSLSRRDAHEAGEPIPKHWEHMSVNESLKVVEIAADSDEYKKVAAYFRYNGAVGNIHKIERVQNRSLYQQFVAKKREIEGRNPNNENEMCLFHGSDINAITAINNTGFNRSYCGKNATVYGLGVYFAQSSAYSEQFSSPDANGLRKLYQVRVLVGVSVETDSNTKFLPKQPGTDIPYDSGRAPPSRTEGIHVIFHDSQAYPEYIITFSLPVTHVAA